MKTLGRVASLWPRCLLVLIDKSTVTQIVLKYSAVLMSLENCRVEILYFSQCVLCTHEIHNNSQESTGIHRNSQQ